MKKPMTVKELQDFLAKQPGDLIVAWVSEEGYTGHLYAAEQRASIDDGHFHLELGGAEEDV